MPPLRNPHRTPPQGLRRNAPKNPLRTIRMALFRRDFLALAPEALQSFFLFLATLPARSSALRSLGGRPARA
eukprot:2808713-Alexandrium_andersonii.AAC.1